VRPEGFYVDSTVGGGGHSAEIARRLAGGRLLALDRDPAALRVAATQLAEFGERVLLKQAAFSRLEEVVRGIQWPGVDGILADLGLSQMQLADPGRGFSFAAEGPLDMRMDPTQRLTAAEVVNRLDQQRLAQVLYQFAEERRSRRIARAIIRARPLRSTQQLAEIVAAASRGSPKQRIHPATRTFQALRIYVNNELEELESLLEQAPRITRPGARMVIISFHSLEDRLVKEAFRRWKAGGTARILTRHVVRPSEAEVAANPRSRSARLRCAERI
jgi:16S rRNA (cytosine1402-N4)-methyltransferase